MEEQLQKGKGGKNREESDHVRDADEWQNEGEEGRPDERVGGEQDGRGRKGG